MENNILIVCGCYPNKIMDEFVGNSIGLSQIAADTLQKNVIKGVYALTKRNVEVLTAPFVGYFPFGYKKLFIKNQRIEEQEATYEVLGWVNIKGFETIIKAEKIYRAAKRWCEKSSANRHIFIYSHYAGFMSAMGRLKRKFPDVVISCMVTDMPELEYKPKGIIETIKKLPSKIMFDTTYRNIKYIDYFNLLSEHMSDKLGVKEEQCCVVECMCSMNGIEEKSNTKNSTNKDLRCFAYTGTLHRRYGIINLIEAFKKVKCENYRLWICGSGDAEQEVIKASEEDNRIVYYGVLSHDETVALQEEADILVNPRSPEGEFTKYSFPSKTIEYMCAGKPVLAFKLAGIPDEYDKYLMYFDDNTTKNMAICIEKAGKLEDEEIKKLGRKNKIFAITEKSFIPQTKKILDLMEFKYE